jgi:hypothetical protein
MVKDRALMRPVFFDQFRIEAVIAVVIAIERQCAFKESIAIPIAIPKATRLWSTRVGRGGDTGTFFS